MTLTIANAKELMELMDSSAERRMKTRHESEFHRRAQAGLVIANLAALSEIKGNDTTDALVRATMGVLQADPI